MPPSGSRKFIGAVRQTFERHANEALRPPIGIDA